MGQYIVFHELTDYSNLTQPLSVAALIVEAANEDEAGNVAAAAGLLMPDASMGVIDITNRKTYGVTLIPELTEQPSP